MKPKSIKPWIILLIAPFIGLTAVALIQLVFKFISGGGSSPTFISIIINIFSLIVGIVSVIAMLGIPLWIIMLVIAISHNGKLKDQTANTPQNPQAQSPIDNPPPSPSPQQPV